MHNPNCRCHDCIVENVKDWEDGEPIYFPIVRNK